MAIALNGPLTGKDGGELMEEAGQLHAAVQRAVMAGDAEEAYRIACAVERRISAWYELEPR